MLQSIRDNAQNWVFLVIIGVLVIAFAFWGIESYFTGGSSSNTIAKVDGYKITQDQYNQAYQRLRRQLQLQMGRSFSLTQEIEKRLKKEAINQIIHSYILTQDALKQGYRITDGQIDTVLMKTPQFQVNGQFSAGRFQAILNTIMYSESAFINQLRSDMLVNQMRLGVLATSFALPQDITTAYQLINQKRDISYIMLTTDQFKKAIKISSGAQDTYYQQNKSQFKTPEEVSISYLKLSMKKLIAKQKFSPAAIKDYYETNKESYTLPARWHVAQILIQLPPGSSKSALAAAKTKLITIEKALKEGRSFSDVAKSYSEDIATVNKGGVMPWFTLGMMGGDFEKVAKQLKVGEVSPPVRTKFGFNIIKLLAHKPEQVQPFDKMKATVEKMMAQDKAQKQFAAESDQLASLTFSNSDSLAPAAKALGLSIQTTELFSRTGEKSGIASKPLILQAAFDSTTLVQGYNSDTIQLDPETVVVLRVKEHHQAAIRPFKAVQADIIRKLTLNAEKEQAKIMGEKLINEIKNTASMAKVSKANKLALITVANARRHDKKRSAAILNAAFALPKPTVSHKISLMGISLASGDYVIVAVTKVIDGDAKAMSPEELNAFSAQLANGYGQMDYSLYVKQQLSQAKIKLEPAITSVTS